MEKISIYYIGHNFKEIYPHIQTDSQKFRLVMVGYKEIDLKSSLSMIALEVIFIKIEDLPKWRNLGGRELSYIE